MARVDLNELKSVFNYTKDTVCGNTIFWFPKLNSVYDVRGVLISPTVETQEEFEIFKQAYKNTWNDLDEEAREFMRGRLQE